MVGGDRGRKSGWSSKKSGRVKDNRDLEVSTGGRPDGEALTLCGNR